MRKVYVIGIGAGDPDYVTVQAVRAMNAADVVFVLEKAEETQDLVELRRTILVRHVEGTPRVVTAQDPPRARGTADYGGAVRDWRRRRADVCEALIRDELAPGRSGAFLAWGDPAFYDSTLGVLEDIRDRGSVEFSVEVVPGISAPQALAARHGVVLNRVGGAIQFTTGRRLAAGGPVVADDVVVMLDAEQAFAGLPGEEWDIYWGAYLGTPDELLIAGRLDEVAEEIATVRARARAAKGWMFDTYLLRRRRG